MSRSTRDCLLGLVWSFSHTGHFFSLVVLPIFSFLLSTLLPARPSRRPYGSTFRVTPRMPFRHFSRARVPLEPQRHRRALRWAPIVRTKDGFVRPNHYLGSQLICMVGLSILLWVVLSLETQWDHFSLFLYVFFLSDPLFLSLFSSQNCIPFPFIHFSYL